MKSSANRELSHSGYFRRSSKTSNDDKHEPWRTPDRFEWIHIDDCTILQFYCTIYVYVEIRPWHTVSMTFLSSKIFISVDLVCENTFIISWVSLNNFNYWYNDNEISKYKNQIAFNTNITISCTHNMLLELVTKNTMAQITRSSNSWYSMNWSFS